MKRASRKLKSNGQGQGMNWIRPVKRLAIYLRDGLACCYCGASIEQEVKLTLDHLKPYSKGGSNAETNLVTCCLRCNSVRGNRKWQSFAKDVSKYINHGVVVSQIINHIESQIMRPLDIPEAEEMIERRGGFTAALQSSKEVL